MYVFSIKFLFRSNGLNLSSQMFPHTFGTNQSIGIFVPELNHLCYDQGVLWMWSLYDRVLAPCTLYIQISCDTCVYNCVGVNLFKMSEYKNSRLVFFWLFEDMVLYTAPSRCVSKVNNKNLKDFGYFLVKRCFSLFFVEVVGTSPNFASNIKRILAY